MGQAQTLIAKALLNTPLEDIYVVVEDYLRLIGYHSNFQVGILGRASALVASGEGLGLAGPKMVVSVCDVNNAMTQPELSHLLEQCPADHQLLVIALSGFEEDAADLRRTYSDKLTLLDASSLTRIIWQYYGHFDEETRRVFPLRTLLWPPRG